MSSSPHSSPSLSSAPALSSNNSPVHDPSQTRLTDMFKVVRKGSASRLNGGLKDSPVAVVGGSGGGSLRGGLRSLKGEKEKDKKGRRPLPPPATASDPPPSPPYPNQGIDVEVTSHPRFNSNNNTHILSQRLAECTDTHETSSSTTREPVPLSQNQGQTLQPPIPLHVSVLHSPDQGRILSLCFPFNQSSTKVNQMDKRSSSSCSSNDREKPKGRPVPQKSLTLPPPRTRSSYVMTLDEGGRANIKKGEREEKVVWTYEGGLAVGEELLPPTSLSDTMDVDVEGVEREMRWKREKVQRWVKAFDGNFTDRLSEGQGPEGKVRVVKADLSGMGRCIVSKDYLMAMGWPFEDSQQHQPLIQHQRMSNSSTVPTIVNTSPSIGEHRNSFEGIDSSPTDFSSQLFEWEMTSGGKKDFYEDCESMDRRRRIEEWFMDETSDGESDIIPLSKDTDEGNPYIETLEEVKVGGRQLVNLLRVKKKRMEERERKEKERKTKEEAKEREDREGERGRKRRRISAIQPTSAVKKKDVANHHVVTGGVRKKNVKSGGEGKGKKKSGIPEGSVVDDSCVCDRGDDGECMVQCDACRVWFHLSCLGLSDAEELGDEWYCFRCSGGLRPKARPRPYPSTSKLHPPTPGTTRKSRMPITPRIETDGFGPVTPPRFGGMGGAQIFSQDTFYTSSPSLNGYYQNGLKRGAPLKLMGESPCQSQTSLMHGLGIQGAQVPNVTNNGHAGMGDMLGKWTPGPPTLGEYREIEKGTREAIAHWNSNETPSRGAGVRGLPWTPPMSSGKGSGWWADVAVTPGTPYRGPNQWGGGRAGERMQMLMNAGSGSQGGLEGM